LSLAPGAAQICSERVTVNLKSAFPFEPFPTRAVNGRIVISDLADALDAVLFAASEDKSKPVLMNVMVKIGEGSLYCAAANGFVLSEYGEHRDAQYQYVLSAIALTELRRWIVPGEMVTIGMNGYDVVIEFWEGSITISPCPNFPDIEALHGTWSDPSVFVDVDREELLAALKPLARFTVADTLRLQCADGVLHLAVGKNDKATAEVATSTDVSFPMMAINIGHLGDALKHINCATVKFGIRKSSHPVTVYGVEREITIMPMKLRKQ